MSDFQNKVSETNWVQWILTLVMTGVFSLTGYIAFQTVQMKSDLQVVKTKIEMFEKYEVEHQVIIDEVRNLEKRVDKIEYEYRYIKEKK